jgi:peptidyl-prolyl cis-trans isomerase SurA
MRFKGLIGLYLFLVSIAFGCLTDVAAETCNRVVAIVNDNVITLYELNRKIKEVTGLTPVDLKQRSQDTFLNTRRQVLDLLIDEKISQGKIKELGIAVTQKQVERAVERVKENNSWTHEDLVYKLETEGLTYEQYVAKMKDNLERVELINYEVKSKIIIREEKIQQYYDKHIDEFSSGGSVHLASIFLVSKDPGNEQEKEELVERGKYILDELRKGKDFGALAVEYSQGPMAGEGGDLGVFKTNQLESEIRQILQGLPIGGFSKLIVRPNGLQIIKLIDRQGGKRKTLNDVRDAIYDILYQAEVNKTYNSWIKTLRENSYTKIIF